MYWYANEDWTLYPFTSPAFVVTVTTSLLILRQQSTRRELVIDHISENISDTLIDAIFFNSNGCSRQKMQWFSLIRCFLLLLLFTTFRCDRSNGGVISTASSSKITVKEIKSIAICVANDSSRNRIDACAHYASCWVLATLIYNKIKNTFGPYAMSFFFCGLSVRIGGVVLFSRDKRRLIASNSKQVSINHCSKTHSIESDSHRIENVCSAFWYRLTLYIRLIADYWLDSTHGVAHCVA